MGDVAAAKWLLAKHEIQAGLMTLREHNLLDASMEALVIQERFASLPVPIAMRPVLKTTE